MPYDHSQSFSELNPNDLYETLVNAGYDMNAEGISTPFIYCGGTLYRVRGWNGYVFINIANGKLHYISEFNACQIRMEKWCDVSDSTEHSSFGR